MIFRERQDLLNGKADYLELAVKFGNEMCKYINDCNIVIRGATILEFAEFIQICKDDYIKFYEEFYGFAVNLLALGNERYFHTNLEESDLTSIKDRYQRIVSNCRSLMNSLSYNKYAETRINQPYVPAYEGRIIQMLPEIAFTDFEADVNLAKLVHILLSVGKSIDLSQFKGYDKHPELYQTYYELLDNVRYRYDTLCSGVIASLENEKQTSPIRDYIQRSLDDKIAAINNERDYYEGVRKSLEEKLDEPKNVSVK